MPKRRRILKWTGVVACVLILVAWGTTAHHCIHHSGRGWTAGLSEGVLILTVPADHFIPHICTKRPDFSVEVLEREWLCQTWPSFSYETNPVRRTVLIPLWLPFLIVALPTAFLFYRDRKRIPQGHCSTCGYNLTGAEHERCPECGAACDSTGQGT